MGVDAGDETVRGRVQINVNLRAHRLDDFDGGLDGLVRSRKRGDGFLVDVFGPAPEYHRFADVAGELAGHLVADAQREAVAGFGEPQPAGALFDGTLEEIHRRRTDEAGHEQVLRV